MTTATPDHAHTHWQCPVSRTFATSDGKCKAVGCPVWRWVPISASDPRIVAARKKAMAEVKMDHKKAVALVEAEPARFGVPTEPEKGYCGLGGEVKA